MEDLLTSDVFSVCKYVRPESILLPLLTSAVSLQGSSLREKLPDTIIDAEYIFWPRLPSSEPDVLIFLHGPKDDLHAIIIEAKYLSGKSGETLDEEELLVAETPADQLAREYQDLQQLENSITLPKRIASRHLVYLTAHRSFPTRSISESLKEIQYFNHNASTESVYWTSWFHLIPLLRGRHAYHEWEIPIVDDLESLLIRKRFIYFNGFSLKYPASKIMDTLFYRSPTRTPSNLYDYSSVFAQISKHSFYRSDRRNPSEYFWQIPLVERTKRIYMGGIKNG
jgi:hypothetical protein